MGANRSCDWLPTGRSCKWELALAQFLEAYHYAKDLKQPVWDFAVDLSRLEAAGLTDNDFRWLIAKGYIEQAVELGGSGVRMKPRFSRHRRDFVFAADLLRSDKSRIRVCESRL